MLYWGSVAEIQASRSRYISSFRKQGGGWCDVREAAHPGAPITHPLRLLSRQRVLERDV